MNVKLDLPDSAALEFMQRLLKRYEISNSRSLLQMDDTAYIKYESTFTSGKFPVVINRDHLLGETLCHSVRKTFVKSLISEVWKSRIKKAEESALTVFTNNLNKMLMTPPLSTTLPLSVSDTSSICGIDPGHSHGHKMVIIGSRNQELLHKRVLYYNKNPIEATNDLKKECIKFNVKVIAIGDGVGCLEVRL
jgi:transcriptional accessory protein Tex/SPT6